MDLQQLDKNVIINNQKACLRMQGFSTLLVVIILGVIVTALALYITTTSLWSVRGSIDDKNSMQSQQLADACAEIALEAMRENNSFTGSFNVTIGSNTCSYTVVNTGGNNRTINITSTMLGVTRKMQITTSAFNPITVVSWQNIGDF